MIKLSERCNKSALEENISYKTWRTSPCLSDCELECNFFIWKSSNYIADRYKVVKTCYSIIQHKRKTNPEVIMGSKSMIKKKLTDNAKTKCTMGINKGIQFSPWI